MTLGSDQAPHHAIIIPFRALGTQSAERCAQLRHVVSALAAARAARQWSTHIVVVQQGDVHAFNRGALLNAGVQWAETARNVVLHDCDLLPSAALLEAYDRLLQAAAPAAERPVHLAARGTRYDSGARFLGGVLGLSRAHFAQALASSSAAAVLSDADRVKAQAAHRLLD